MTNKTAQLSLALMLGERKRENTNLTSSKKSNTYTTLHFLPPPSRIRDQLLPPNSVQLNLFTLLFYENPIPPSLSLCIPPSPNYILLNYTPYVCVSVYTHSMKGLCLKASAAHRPKGIKKKNPSQQEAGSKRLESPSLFK